MIASPRVIARRVSISRVIARRVSISHVIARRVSISHVIARRVSISHVIARRVSAEAIQATLFFLLFCFVQPASAWNARGHELVAEIALMQLTPREVARLQAINQSCRVGVRVYSMAKSAAWLDWVRQDPTLSKTKPYHYIDLPFSADGTTTKPPSKDNAVNAIQHARAVLTSTKASDADKCVELRILMHVVGDIHQPLHAISRYSRALPNGDRGGNDFKLGKNRVANNLHAYWDRGGGSLMSRGHRGRPANLHRRAEALLKQYPCHPGSLDPMVWAQESHALAKTKAYQTVEGAKPSVSYQRQVKAITQERLALAGCRLAMMLKAILSEPRALASG